MPIDFQEDTGIDFQPDTSPAQSAYESLASASVPDAAMNADAFLQSHQDLSTGLPLSLPISRPDETKWQEVKGAVGSAAESLGNIARAIPADLAAAMRLDPSISGNIPTALRDQPMPIDEQLRLASQDSTTAADTLGRVSQGIASAAPLAAIGGLPGWMAKLIAAGFTADMIATAPKAMEEYTNERFKPESEQDPEKLSQLKADLIQRFVFAPLAGAGSLPKLNALFNPAIRPIQFAREAFRPIQPTLPKATPIPYRRPGEGPPTYSTAGQPRTPVPPQPVAPPGAPLPVVPLLPSTPTPTRVETKAGPGDVVNEIHGGALLEVKLDNGETRLFTPDTVSPISTEKGVTDASTKSKTEGIGVHMKGEINGQEAPLRQSRQAAETQAGTPPHPTPDVVTDRPAILTMEGELVPGKQGEVHNDIIAENNLKAEDIDRRTFVDEQGNEISRQEMAPKVAAAGVEPSVPATAGKPAEAHAPDLAEAQAKIAEPIPEPVKAEPTPPVAEAKPAANVPTRELFTENAIDDLDSFHHCEKAGSVTTKCPMPHSRFTDYAKSDRSGKSLNKLVTDFAKNDKATPSQIRKLRESVTSVLKNEKVSTPEPPRAEAKPAPAPTPAVAVEKVRRS